MATSATQTIQTIPLSSIQDDERFQVRFRVDDCAKLRKSIEKDGMISPVDLWRKNRRAKTYFIIEGHRRVTVLRQLGEETVPAFVRDDLTEEEALRQAYLQNAERKALGPLDEARALHLMQENHGLTGKQAQDALGFGKDKASRLLKLLKLPPVVQDALADERMTQSHALALEGYTGGDLPSLISRIEKGLSVRALERLVAGNKKKSSSKEQSTSKGTTGRGKPVSVVSPGKKKAFSVSSFTFTPGATERKQHLQWMRDAERVFKRLESALDEEGSGGLGGTQEWSGTSLNFQRGCENNCLYCYARQGAVRKGQTTSEEWEKPTHGVGGKRLLADDSPLPRLHEPTPGNIALKRDTQPYMFPTSHDITPDNLDSAIHLLRRALRGGNYVLVVSKPRLECIKALCKEFSGYRNQILFRFTIGSADDDALGFWEPGAPSFEERLASLKYAHSHGFKTSVSCEPMLDGNVEAVVEATLPYVSDAIWIGTLNNLLLKGTEKLAAGAEHLNGYQDQVLAVVSTQGEDRLRELEQTYKDQPRVKWKKHVKNVLGIEPLKKPDTAWFTEEPPPIRG